jgi:Na+-driven multidrug efflux pump
VLGALSAGLLALAFLTAWWGPAWGPQGAAWAVLYAESLQAIILSFQAARRLRGAAAVTKEA